MKKKRYSEKIVLISPEKTLKLEGFDSEKATVNFMGKKYKVNISYNRQEWMPLSETKLKSIELAHDISTMEKSLETALKLAYVSDCFDYCKKEEQSIGTKRSASTNCFIDNELCDLIWENWTDLNGSSFDYSETPFHDDWYPDEIGDEDDPWFEANGSPSCGGHPPQTPSNCPDGSTLYSKGGTASKACKNAKEAAADRCGQLFSCEPSCNTCKRKGWGYKAAVRYKCDLPPLAPFPTGTK